MTLRESVTTRRNWLSSLAAGSLVLVGTASSFAHRVARRNKQGDGRQGKLSPTELKKMKTIGVLGGIGPQATMDFEVRVHRVAQQRVPASLNGGYPPMLVYYHRKPPVLLKDDGKPIIPYQPDPDLIEAARRLGPMVDFLVITSNGAHVIQPDIERVSRRKVVSMVDGAIKEVQKRGWSKAGVIGMGEPLVYTKPLGVLGVRTEILDPAARENLNAAFFRVMEGREDPESRALATRAVAALRDRGVDGIILGCTELPFLLGNDAEAQDLLNPTQVLAENAVLQAIQ